MAPSPFSVIIAVPEHPLNQRRLETSYTVQLGLFLFLDANKYFLFFQGAQLKSMYNLRLIRCDTLDYCRSKTTKKE